MSLVMPFQPTLHTTHQVPPLSIHNPFIGGQNSLPTSLVTMPFQPLPPLHDVCEPQQWHSLLPHASLTAHEPLHITRLTVSHNYQSNLSFTPFQPPQSHAVPSPATTLAQPIAKTRFVFTSCWQPFNWITCLHLGHMHTPCMVHKYKTFISCK